MFGSGEFCTNVMKPLGVDAVALRDLRVVGCRVADHVADVHAVVAAAAACGRALHEHDLGGAVVVDDEQQIAMRQDV
jgi:hypothetical protein